ncbi:PQQ-dependent sugar dehydrogenase [Candidatus Woesebacteria bacterium]|nr:PQQ-dependent sugar dehydrogenase [Candidatus Woesebacteria bacterium]MCD8507385.1 PQQ-dependent sugar dehydrogenase [Candidatus Woesebacteria bacterium]MCD8527033.1 PQQ-dependent sugar dehydrogenase [Candidatus Woesebacteria bacterium]MCD8545905.1 PQQ-dependent sugar dehydrogenase [Candidatus Woesebacteria bacterium]
MPHRHPTKRKTPAVRRGEYAVWMVVGTLVMVSVLGLVGYWGFQRIGDIRPALSQPDENFAELIRQSGNSSSSNADGNTVPVPDGTTTENVQNSPITLPEGFTIQVAQTGLSQPRDLLVSPENILLFSDKGSGEVKAMPLPAEIGSDTDFGAAKTLVSGLDVPHGLALSPDGQTLLVTEETALMRYDWNAAELTLTNGRKILDMPAGGRHTTRSLVVTENGEVFISLGSSCDTCFEDSEWLAAVVKTDLDGNSPVVYATGLRNAVFMTQHPQTNDIWVTEMGRDFLGDNLPPDEINVLQANGNYGWPVCYGNQVYDEQFGQRSPEYCADTIAPVFKIQAHSAPLGLTFIQSEQFPEEWQGDLLVAYHGSWNRTVPVGYKIVRLEVGEDNTSVTSEQDFLTGFLQDRTAFGRPVDVEFDQNGHLYISDDKSGAIYVVRNTAQPQADESAE